MLPPSDHLSLKRRVLTASSWTLVGFGASQAIRFGSNLFLTRLLAPDIFGVVAIAIIISIGLEMFSDLGLRPNIIQSKRGDDPDFLNTAWVVQILRGLVLWIGALLIAAVIVAVNSFHITPPGSVYADSRLPYVLAILSLTVAISG